MAKCMACGKTALLSTNFGKVILCKSCSSLLDVPSWSSRDFESMNELQNKKTMVLQKAVANRMPENILAEIAKYFDEYINAGFITMLNGKAGQTLKVFANYCIINTKNENKKSELESTFYQFEEDDDNEDDSLISSADKRNIVQGLMSGKLLQTGIGVALSATMNQQEKEKAAEKKSRERHKNVGRLINVGDRIVDYKFISRAECFSNPNTTNGYLRFVPKEINSNYLYACEYFFFNNSKPFETKKIKQRLETIKNVINERIVNIVNEVAQQQAQQRAQAQEEQVRRLVAEATQQQPKTDAFDEIRKFKQLLDEGIISETEFNSKKKELLGL